MTLKMENGIENEIAKFLKDGNNPNYLNDVVIEEREKDGLKVKVIHKQVTDETITDFRDNCIAKFIFFDPKYDDISSDTEVHEIHKLKSKYRGNTYTRVPFKVVKNEDSKYPNGIEETTDENAEGYVVVNNHDLWKDHRDLKDTTKEKRVVIATKLCQQYLAKYGAILSNEIYVMKVFKDDDNYVELTRYQHSFDIDETIELAKGFLVLD